MALPTVEETSHDQPFPAPFAVRRPKSSPVRRRPRLEALEDRLVPSAYHVSSLLDDGSAGTLR